MPKQYQDVMDEAAKAVGHDILQVEKVRKIAAAFDYDQNKLMELLETDIISQEIYDIAIALPPEKDAPPVATAGKPAVRVVRKKRRIGR